MQLSMQLDQLRQLPSCTSLQRQTSMYPYKYQIAITFAGSHDTAEQSAGNDMQNLLAMMCMSNDIQQ